jgi:HipA-like protein
MLSKTWKYRYKEPPPTLVVLFHQEPIAELQESAPGAAYKYVFRYLPAFEKFDLRPFPGLSFTREDQQFIELPTYFEERLPDLRRPDIQELMHRYRFSSDSKVQLLAHLGSHTITDPFEFRLRAA